MCSDRFSVYGLDNFIPRNQDFNDEVIKMLGETHGGVNQSWIILLDDCVMYGWCVNLRLFQWIFFPVLHSWLIIYFHSITITLKNNNSNVMVAFHCQNHPPFYSVVQNERLRLYHLEICSQRALRTNARTAKCAFSGTGACSRPRPPLICIIFW